MSIIIRKDERLKNDEMVFDYDWIKLGYTGKGQLIQKNKKTKEIRILDEWVEIFKNET